MNAPAPRPQRLTRRQRLLWRYGILCAAVLGGLAVLGPRLIAPRETAEEVDGAVVGLTDEWSEAIPPDAPAPRFTPLPLRFRHFPGTRTHRLPEDMGSGFAIADFDGDGLDDLFFANAGPLGAPPPPCEVWRNVGALAFERVATPEPLPSLMGMGVATGDYDADGDLDVYVTGYGRNALLRNDGGFRFADVTEETGTRGGGFSAGACFGDADGDGDLDLYVSRYVVFDEALPPTASTRGSLALPATLNPATFPPETNLLFLNEGTRFREAAREMAVDNPAGKSLGAVFADLDGDGLQDLYVVNDVSDNALFQGRRAAPFADATYSTCTSDWRGAMGLAVGDPDRDDDLDLFITHWQTEENTLFVKEEGFLFRDASMSTYLGPPGRGRVGWGADFADLDADGRPDVLVVNGSTFEVPEDTTRLAPQRLQVFWNDGRRFHDLASRATPSMSEPLVARASLAADLDRDGDVDWLVGVHGGSPVLWRNDTPQGHWLVVEARGSAPNLLAYGARVTVETGPHREARQVGAQISYLASGPPALHFGLGRATKADRVVVRFPSGKVVERRDVPADQRIVVREVDPRSLGPLIDRVGDALAAGKTEEARAVLADVLRQDPDHPTALYRMAQIAEPREALALLDRLARVDPVSARGWLLRAKILSDPRHPALGDLDAALAALAEARRVNPNETGVSLEEGRILLLRGEPAKAAAVLETVDHNPRAAALAALAHLRAGNLAAATRLLGHRPGEVPAVAEEGDTAHKKRGDRDLLARLLDLGGEASWEMSLLPQDRLPHLPDRWVDATVPARYGFEEAARFALAPPGRAEAPPPGTTGLARGDLDGDGDEDLLAVQGGDDPTTSLPWWGLLREETGYRLLRGTMPEPGLRWVAAAVLDADGDGRTDGLLRDDRGRVWVLRLAGAQ